MSNKILSSEQFYTVDNTTQLSDVNSSDQSINSHESIIDNIQPNNTHELIHDKLTDKIKDDMSSYVSSSISNVGTSLWTAISERDNTEDLSALGWARRSYSVVDLATRIAS